MINPNKERFSIFSPDFIEEKTPETELITPQEARQFVEGLCYQEESWDNILAKSLLNHEIRALIYIARQNNPRTLQDVYLEQYPDGNHNSLGDIEAEIAATQVYLDNEWEKFARNHPEDLTPF